MNFATRIKGLAEVYLADVRTPNIAAFVEQLFSVAAETGGLACALSGEKAIQFSLQQGPNPAKGQAPSQVRLQTDCHVEHAAARAVLRMLCARLGMICKEQTGRDVSLYGDQMVIDYEVQGHNLWSVSFTNTTDRQDFVIQAL